MWEYDGGKSANIAHHKDRKSHGENVLIELRKVQCVRTTEEEVDKVSSTKYEANNTTNIIIVKHSAFLFFCKRSVIDK